MRWFISALCLSMLVSSTAFGAPKEKPKKGKPSDQPTLDLYAPLTNDAMMKIDSNLKDWDETSKEIEFSTLLSGEYDYDWTGPKDLSGKVRAHYGAERIYFHVTVKDNAVVAKKKNWKSDRVELWLAPEDASGKALASPRGALFDIGPALVSGYPEVKWLSGKQGGLEAAAYIDNESYEFEIGVDYSALSKNSPVLDGSMRFCVLVRDWDQDDPNEDEATIGTCPIDPKKASSIKPAQMGKIKLNLGSAMWDQIIAHDKILAGIDAQWTKIYADISGTPMLETIAFAGDTLVVAGYGLNNSNKLSWSSIALASGTLYDAPKIEVKDVDGDKLKEIIVTRNETCVSGDMTATRSYLFKYSSEGIHYMGSYVTELKSEDGVKSIKNNIKFTPAGYVQTLDKKSTPNMPACVLKASDDMGPIITPESEEKTLTQSYL